MKASRPSRKELNRLEHCGAGIGGEAHHLFPSPKMAQIPEILTRPPYRCAAGLMIKTDEVSEQGWTSAPLHLDAVEEDVNIFWAFVSFGDEDPVHWGTRGGGVYRCGVAKFRAMVRCSSRVGRVLAAQRLSSGSLPCCASVRKSRTSAS
jgi:hypothetical protein